MGIKGIKLLKVDIKDDGSLKVNVVYTEEFVDILKKVLKKNYITDKEVVDFISSDLDSAMLLMTRTRLFRLFQQPFGAPTM